MAADLPDVEQSLSYVVDDGEATGPLALAEIARSVGAGERTTDVYVWWVGAHEWVPFGSDARLLALLPEPSLDMPALPPEVLEHRAEDSDTEDSDTEDSDTEDSDSASRVSIGYQAIDLTVPDEIVIEADQVVEVEEVVVIDAEVEEFEGTATSNMSIFADEESHLLKNFTPDTTVVPEDLDLDEITVSENSVLAGVGARLEALALSTRHYQSSMRLDSAGATPVDGPEIVVDPEISDERESVFGNDFAAMVRRTAQYQRLAEQSERVRELLSRACAAVICQQGYSVESRTDLRGHYFLNFENASDTRRIRIEVTPAASVSGGDAQYVSLAMTWGRLAFDIDEALETLLAQPPMADAKPGTITADADLDTGSVFTRINLVLPIDSYIGDDFSIDRGALQDAMRAAQHGLEQRWYQLFIPAE